MDRAVRPIQAFLLSYKSTRQRFKQGTLFFFLSLSLHSHFNTLHTLLARQSGYQTIRPSQGGQVIICLLSTRRKNVSFSHAKKKSKKLVLSYKSGRINKRGFSYEPRSVIGKDKVPLFPQASAQTYGEFIIAVSSSGRPHTCRRLGSSPVPPR